MDAAPGNSQPATTALIPGADAKGGVIAYFSMEIGLEEGIPTYSGGLGMLAGDTIRSASDLELPMVAVSLLHRRGYFRQHLARDGTQTEDAVAWSPEDRLDALPRPDPGPDRGTRGADPGVALPGEWACGGVVPVYLLDTDLEENARDDRRLTDHLYGGDARYRLCQEAILGIGGRAPAAGAGLREHPPLPHERGTREPADGGARARVRRDGGLAARSPDEVVGAGQAALRVHDAHAGGGRPRQVSARAGRPRRHRLRPRFRSARPRVLSRRRAQYDIPRPRHQPLRQRRGEEARRDFAAHVRAVQDRLDHQRRARRDVGGAAVARDVRPPHSGMAARQREPALRAAASQKLEVWDAHRRAKQAAVRARSTNAPARAWTSIRLTIGFARRATAYKRADLLFWNLERLLADHSEKGLEFQIDLRRQGASARRRWARISSARSSR